MSDIVTIKILTSGHGQRESIQEETKHLAHLGHTLLHGDGGDEGLLHLRVQVRLQLKLSLQVAIGDASHVDEEQDDVADVEIVGMPGSCVVAMELPEHWVRQKDIDGVADITVRCSSRHSLSVDIPDPGPEQGVAGDQELVLEPQHRGEAGQQTRRS